MFKTSSPAEGSLVASRMKCTAVALAVMAVLGGTAYGDDVQIAQAASAEEAAQARGSGERVTENQSLEQVIVTGSRIRRERTVTSAPVAVVDSSIFAERGFVSAAQALNQVTSVLPQIPQADGRGSSSGSGQQFPDLFGLGEGRTLTLINGRRMVSSPVIGTDEVDNRVVDANVVPTGLIERIEVVEAGGAAVYGSDAIAGVVNYVLKTDFEGLEMDGQTGRSSRGDYSVRSYRVTAGKNFSENRGNVALNLEYSKSPSLFNSDRNRWTLAEPSFDNPADTGPDDGRPPALRVRGARATFWDSNYVGVIYGDPSGDYPFPDETTLVRLPGAPPTQGLQLSRDGKTLVPFNTGFGLTPGSFPSIPFAAGGDGFDFGELASLYTGIERKNAALIGHYDITDRVRFSTEGIFSRTEGRDPFGTEGIYTSVLNDPNPGSGAIRFNRDYPYLTQQMIDTLDEASDVFRDGGDVYLSKQWSDLVPTRAENTSTDTWRGMMMLSGDLSQADRKFNWELSYSRAVAKGTVRSWNIWADRFENAVNATRDSAGNIVCGINADDDTSNDDPACAPLNPFGIGNYSQAAANYVVLPVEDRYRNTQNDVLATFGGDLVHLPSGTVAFSVSYEHRKEHADFDPAEADQLGLTPLSVPVESTSAGYHTNEFSAEVVVPLLGDEFKVPWVETLELDGQYRRVSNSIAGKENVWGSGLRWETGHGITLRVSRSRNFRAPTLNQLFEPARTQLDAIGDIDPCDSRAINDGTVPDVRRANCLALFTANPGYGVSTLPEGVADTPENRLENFQSLASNFPSALITTGGNPDLRNEVSKTWTFGIVLQPSFVPGLSISADRIQIDLRDGLSRFDSFNFLNTCVDSVSMPEDVCSVVTRDDDGQIVSGRSTTFNAGKVRFRGEVYRANYVRAIEASGKDYGTMALTVEATHTALFETSVTGFDLDRTDDTQTNPDWVGRLDAQYSKGPVTITYTVNYLPRTRIFYGATSDADENPTLDSNTRHSISGSYAVGNFNIRAGIENLTDRGPSYPTSTYGDVLGRQYFLGLNYRL